MATKVREIITARFPECEMAWGDGTKLVVVLKTIGDEIAGTIRSGAAKLDGLWYRVTGVGDQWQLNWAHRQQTYEIIDNRRLIAALNRTVEKEITDMPSLQSLAARNRVARHG